MKKIFQYAAYLGLRMIEGLFSLLPLGWCWTLGGFGGRVFGFFARPYRRLVTDNLRIAFGIDTPADELDALATQHFVALGQNLISSLKVATMPTEEVAQLYRVEGREHLDAAVASDRGIVGGIAHMGNWEILSQISALFPSKRATMYQSLANPFIDRHVVRSRSRIGVTLFDRSDSIFGPLKFLREGGNIGVLFDQHAGDLGTWVPLFDRLASTTRLPALLAIKSKALILPIAVRSDGPGRWCIMVQPAIDPADPIPDRVDRASHLTLRLNQALENFVRRAPSEWFWVHDRWKTPEPDFLLAKNPRVLQCARLPEVADRLQPFRLLVRSPNPLGDACMAIPAVRAMKRGARPDLELTVLCRKNLQPLWQRVAEVDRVIAIERSDSARAVGKTLRDTARFDTAVLLPNSLSSALECRFADIPRIIGMAGHQRSRFLKRVVPAMDLAGPTQHHSQTYLHIAADCGTVIDDEPSRFADDHALIGGGGKARPSESVTETLTLRIGISPGAEYGNAKRWPVERYAETAQEVDRQLRESGKTGEFHIFGSPNEAELAAALAEKIADLQPVNRAGQTSIDELCDELSECQVVLSNDTGTMHLAAALGVPTVAIFGSTEPAWTAPLGHGHRVVRRHVECSPCFLRDCPRDYRCMNEIDTRQVVEAVLLAGSDPC